jgi:hypothetical protein
VIGYLARKSANRSVSAVPAGLHLAPNPTPHFPDFLHAALDRSAYAAFFTESRTRFIGSTKLHRKSGYVRGYFQTELSKLGEGGCRGVVLGQASAAPTALGIILHRQPSPSGLGCRLAPALRALTNYSVAHSMVPTYTATTHVVLTNEAKPGKS